MGTLLLWMGSILRHILTWGWGDFLLSLLLGAWLSQYFGKQAKYAYEFVSHSKSLVRGQWLCPNCLGTTHEEWRTSDSPAGTPCFFCLNQNMTVGTQLGYVRFRYLVKAWDWRRWCQNPTYHSNMKGIWHA